MSKRTFYFIVMSTLLTLIVSGCVKSNDSVCTTGKGNLNLQLSFTLNNNNRDHFTDAVNDVRLYVFDSLGALAWQGRYTASSMKNKLVSVVLPPGRYNVLSLCSSGPDLSLQYDDPYISASRGLTSAYDDYSFGLRAAKGASSSERVDITTAYDDLFHGMITGVSTVRGESSPQKIELIKNTNTLQINVSGLQYIAGRNPGVTPPLKVFAESRNGIYTSDNTPSSKGPTMHYEPLPVSLDGSTMKTEIKTLRLHIATQSTEPMFLYFQDPVTKANILPPIDILAALMRVRGPGGQLLYQTQQDLDRQDIYPISISIASDLSCSVSINEWEIDDLEPELRY